jgi:azurin
VKVQIITAAILFGASMFAAAENCEITVEGNDALQYNVKSIEVPASCEEFKVTLKHVGKLPKQSMGHNFVLGLTADMAAINADGLKAGPSNDYLKPDDERVIAATDLIGGGETTSVTIPVSKLSADESYTYFCSFPGHSALMKGELKLGS